MLHCKLKSITRFYHSIVGGARLAPEAFEELAVLRQFFGEEFERHAAAKLGVLGLVRHTHAAPTQLLQDAVMRNGLADDGGRSAFASKPTPKARRVQTPVGMEPTWPPAPCMRFAEFCGVAFPGR
jgi:hypothetical protein